jgi:retrograde regulation protein 2
MMHSTAPEKASIPPEVIHEVLAALLRFKNTCVDFGVPDNQIRVIATEATREAINTAKYRKAIRDRLGWEVEMLPKER